MVNTVGNHKPPPGDKRPSADRQAVAREGEFMTVYLETEEPPGASRVVRELSEFTRVNLVSALNCISLYQQQ